MTVTAVVTGNDSSAGQAQSMLEVKNVPRAFLEAPLGIWGRGKFRGLVSREGVSSNLYGYTGTAYLCLALDGIAGGGSSVASLGQNRAKTKQKSRRAQD